jgi:DNA modification methylase
MEINKIYQGNCLEILKNFPDNCIDCIVTSPPYWAVRDYGEQNEIIWDGDKDCNHEFETTERKINSGTSKGTVQASVDKEGGYATDWKYTDKYCKKCNAWKGQLGLEEHPQQYINHIVQIIKECKRVLKKSGTIWLNLGDSFYTKSGSGTGSNYPKRHEELDGGRGELTKAQKKANYNIQIPEGQKCEECNSELAQERHHPDYSKPLEIKFVCICCHNKLHGK